MTREEKLLKIFEIADKNRDLEIKLYWERSKYFFNFISVFFASVLGLAAYLTSKYFSKDINDNALILGSIGLIILSTLLLFFSVGFWLSHKANKFWQENWENILGVIERKIFGDDFVYSVILFREEFVKKIYKENKNNNNKEDKIEFNYKYLFHPTKPFFISPSKINANLSIIIVATSYILFIFSFCFLFAIENGKQNIEYLIEAFFSLLIFSLIFKFITIIMGCSIRKIFACFLPVVFLVIFFIIFFFYFQVNKLIFVVYLIINVLIICFIYYSVNDFAKNDRKIINSYKHKYMITFNIIDDEENKNGNLGLEKLHFDELNNGDDK